MKNCIVGLALLFLFVACGKKEEAVLPQDKMKLVMWDLVSADNWFLKLGMKDTTAVKNKKNIALYQQVFKLHDITKEQFYTSYKYYELHPDEMKTLLDSLDAYAAKKKADLEFKPTPLPVKKK